MLIRESSSPRVRPFAMLCSAIALFAAPGAMADHSWGNYHWPTTYGSDAKPISLKLGDNLTGTWGVFLINAEFDWEQSPVLDLSVGQGAPTNLRRCAPARGNVEICNDSYGNNGWLGIASISIEGDHIVAGSVRLNDFYFELAAYNTPDWRQFVMCQEVGHVFGLDHQDEAFDNTNLDTCMDYTSDPWSNQHPNQHDFEQLLAIYSHADSTSGGGSGGGGPGCKGGPKKCPNGSSVSELRAQLDLAAPSQWGRLVSAHGPQEIFELDLGQGRKIITHVLWVPERALEGHGH
jgi:hypothetical protein